MTRKKLLLKIKEILINKLNISKDKNINEYTKLFDDLQINLLPLFQLLIYMENE